MPLLPVAPAGSCRLGQRRAQACSQDEWAAAAEKLAGPALMGTWAHAPEEWGTLPALQCGSRWGALLHVVNFLHCID